MMSILVSFFIYTLFLVVSNREGLDRKHADYFQGSDYVTVKGRLRVNFVLWQALFHRILSLCHYRRLQDSVPLRPYGCLELGINSPFNRRSGFLWQCHNRTSRSWFDVVELKN